MEPSAGPPPSGAAPAAPDARPSDGFSPYPRRARRQQVLVALLAAVTAIGIVLLLLDPPGGVQRHRPPPPPDVAACTAGQTQDCVGSTTRLLPAVPVAAPVSAPKTPSAAPDRSQPGTPDAAGAGRTSR